VLFGRGEKEMTIRFFFPYRSPSGVCSTFARVAEDIASRCSVKTAVLDYKDGYLRRSLKGTGCVTVEDFEDNRSVTIPEGDVLVLQAGSPSCLRPELKIHRGARLVFWQMHPFNFIPSLIPLLPNGSWLARRPGIYQALLTAFHGTKRRRVIEFIELLSRKGALFSYEQPSVQMTERLLGCRVPNPILLAVPVEVPDAPPRRSRLAQDSLQVGWVGRLYDFKIHILAHTLKRFSDYARQQQLSITFHIIGDGPESRRLDALDLQHRFFKIHKTGDLNPKMVIGYLASNVDLVTAMGSSALEGALTGLPTILLDFSYGPVPYNYRFRWLYDTKGFDLGHAITGEDCDPNEDVLPGMMETVHANYTALGEKGFVYCVKNHSMSHIGDRFIELVQSSLLKFEDIPETVLRKSFLRRMHERLRH
jgi:glycosyltransferase involved in cell wall biosynthesis